MRSGECHAEKQGLGIQFEIQEDRAEISFYIRGEQRLGQNGFREPKRLRE
jgi:hypothetical protein